MPFSVFSKVRLAGVSAVVPSGSVRIEDELKYYGGEPEKARRLTERSGLAARCLAPDGVTASDLCLQAAASLLEHCRTDKNEIGALIFVSHSADYPLPASAALQQYALGLSRDCASFDMNVGCAGWIKGLWTASGLLESGACSKVLLLAGDTPGRFQNPANRVTAPVFGDAGTASLLERVESPPAGSGTGGTLSFLLGSDGSGYEALAIPGGGARIPPSSADTPDSLYNRAVTDAKGNPWTLGGYCRIWMDAMAIYAFSVSVIPGHLKRHLALTGKNAAKLDALLLHQANKVIVESIAKRLELPPDKVPGETLPKYGNLGSSSVPALICEHYAPDGAGRNEPKNEVMLCAFGAGLAWGSCLLSLSGTVILPVAEYRPPETTPARDELITHWHRKFGGDL